jgi:hypothetical protein
MIDNMFWHTTIDPNKAKKTARANAAKALRRLGLTDFVTLDEIERELGRVKTAFKSLLILGIISRIMARDDDKALKLFMPAITEWKNYLPHPDLDGMSPFEYREKYPPGPYEARFLAELMQTYQERLEILNRAQSDPADIEKDFAEFQNQYLTRVPSNQLQMTPGRYVSLKELIIEERRRNAYPEKDIDKIGIQLFVENTADGLGYQIAKLDNEFIDIVTELAKLHKQRQLPSRARLKKIRAFFERSEPFFSVGPEPHKFYLNFANVAVIENNFELAESLLDRALMHNPDYILARNMKTRLAEYVK